MNTILDCLDWAVAHVPEGFALAALFTFGMYLKGMYPSVRRETKKAMR